MFTDNKDFYPTPPALIEKMYNEIQGSPTFILEPSAGKGDIVDFFKENYRYCYDKIGCIEKDETLINILRGKGHIVIDRDFLSYAGAEKFDLIIMNPPFSEGDKHLLKAIEILYSGQIICLLNAETLKNPYSNTRKLLVKKLEELKAKIEFIPNAFIDAERKTGVEVALISITIDRKVEDDIFHDMKQANEMPEVEVKDQTELTQKNSIRNLVADYNRTLEIGTETLLNYFKNYNHIGEYISLNLKEADNRYQTYTGTLTDKLKTSMNDFLKKLRIKYWREVLDIEVIRKKMTEKKVNEFNVLIQQNSAMDFTESNIRQFICNLMNDYGKILEDSTLEIFDRMTYEHAFDKDLHNKNVHYFNGWKTNKAFQVNDKVIIPFYGDAFRSWGGSWSVSCEITRKLDDIDKVMNSFDTKITYKSIAQALTESFEQGITKNIESEYFTLTVYKKGTLHLTFRDKDILRRFNVTACRGKNWLPYDYGQKYYEDLNTEERSTVDSFEGKPEYNKNLTYEKYLFRGKMDIGLITEGK